jgi:hypothetical protein
MQHLNPDVRGPSAYAMQHHATHATSPMLHVLHGFACVAWQRHVSGLRATSQMTQQSAANETKKKNDDNITV